MEPGRPATGSNPNPFYTIAAINKPLIGEKATLKGIAINGGNLYDINTTAGMSYEFVQQ